MPHAIGNAKMGTLFAEGPSILISFGLGTAGKMREPFLDSPESSDLVREMNLIFSMLVLLRDLYVA